MCGIAGFLTPSRDASAENMHAMARSMADALQHRGPDDAGTWVDPSAGVGLGHRRLSVVDLSPLGHQPMQSASRRYVIVYNGEIYNFRSLREELTTLGHAFRSRSDTEVMLAAITQWGLYDALRRFNGMFAFALWDQQEHTLHLARDRFGEKPLYYGRFGGTLIFGSELKGLRAHPSFRNNIDRDALGLFMRYGYVPTPYCIYEGVRKLPAASVLTLSGTNADSQRVPEPYWSLTDVALRSVGSPFQGSVEEAATELEDLLKDSVRLRLEADVPLGAFLSGGIDSSTVVALMQGQVTRPVRTFTIGFDEARYNEAEDAKKVAQHLGTDHTELYVSPAEAMAVIPRLSTLYDEPFADSSQIPTFLISSLARRHVTVSLSGDGGDELLAGYSRYLLGSGITRALLRSPRPVRNLIGRTLGALAPATWDRLFGQLGKLAPSIVAQRRMGSKIHRLAGLLTNGSANVAPASIMSIWDRPKSVVLGSTDAAESMSGLIADATNLDPTHRMMLADGLTYLPDDILVKVDRASMGVSLETRVPFLDHRVAEFCWRLPLSMKIRNGQQKWILRQVLDKHVPKSLIDRPKTGFAVPIGAWLRGPMRDWAEDLLTASSLRAQGFLNPDRVRPVWENHLSERENRQEQLWCALMFESWMTEQLQPSAVSA